MSVNISESQAAALADLIDQVFSGHKFSRDDVGTDPLTVLHSVRRILHNPEDKDDPIPLYSHSCTFRIEVESTCPVRPDPSDMVQAWIDLVHNDVDVISDSCISVDSSFPVSWGSK
jgi:hypothetical protein